MISSNEVTCNQSLKKFDVNGKDVVMIDGAMASASPSHTRWLSAVPTTRQSI
jgi:hypothetical protein